jgi:hypothetical protein
MEYTITLSPSYDSTPTFYYGVNSYDLGQYARFFDATCLNADNLKFRIPGTWGSYILRGGALGHKITMTVRYINYLEELEKQIREDNEFFSLHAYDIEHGGQTYYGCNLIPGTFKKANQPTPTGRDIDTYGSDNRILFVDIMMQFTEDNPPVIS